MLAELSALGLVVAAGAFGLARLRRRRLYRAQSGKVADIGRSPPLELRLERHGTPDFDKALVKIPDFLPAGVFARLRADILGLDAQERAHVPIMRRGATAAYETLIAEVPSVVAYYHSPDLMRFISRVVGAPVEPTPINDQSSLSILHYDKPLDHIGWHYDHNFYRGRHFTALLTILNEGNDKGGLSHAVLTARLDGQAVAIPTEPNSLVLFEGARVRHKVTPLHTGECRVVLSMTCCTDPRARLWQGIARRVKDTAFYGVRALWT
ncbi:MAG: 2OG-Fe(II) oxygenase [Reyranellaceae bacterium]